MNDPATAATTGRFRHVTWKSFLATGLTLTAVLVLLPGWTGELLWDVVPLMTVGAMVLGIRRYRPAAPVAWWYLTAGIAWGTLAELVWKGWFVAVGDADLIPWWYDWFYIPTYVLLTIGFTRLPRNSLRVHHDTATMDAVVVVVGYVLLYWALVYRADGITEADADPQQVLAVISLVVGLTVHLMAARLWFRYGNHNMSYAFLAVGIASASVADVLYSITLDGDASPGASILDTSMGEAVGSAAWLVWFVLFGTAALHPSSVGTDDAPPTRALTLTRGVMFFAVVTAGPAAFLSTLGRGPSVTVAWSDLAVPLLTVGVLSAILVGRLVAGNSVAQRRAILLDKQAAELSHALQEQRELQELLSHQALHDSLTGLGNRAQFTTRLAEAEGSTGRAVLMVDLDGFKAVNDEHGHPAGDELLRQVGVRMRDVVGEDATVARLGGDEFAVLLDAPDTPTAHDAAWRVVRVLGEPFVFDGVVLSVTACVGVRVLDGAVGSEEALRDADLALYAAKSAGKNQACVFTPRLRTEHAGRSNLLSGLKHAVSRDELAVDYQPVVDLRTRRILSVEALVRWDPPRGRVMPDEFIPVAEETGLIVPIGEHVLRRALTDARPWHTAHGVSIHVNVSAAQVQRPDIVTIVKAALDAAGLPGTALVLEITETALLATGRPEAILVAAHLTSLRDLGVRIAIDDFGTGYSSLAYLQRLPVDIVKIDGAFTRFAAGPGDEARRRRALATAIIDLCASLDLQAVAEQIETEAEAQAIAALGCPQGQGYLFGRPVPPEQIGPLLALSAAPVKPVARLVQQRTPGRSVQRRASRPEQPGTTEDAPCPPAAGGDGTMSR